MANEKYIVSFPELGLHIEANAGDNLLGIIRKQDLPIDAPCGGTGRCGKCKVLIDDQVRYACLTHVMQDIAVTLPNDTAAGASDSGYAILADHTALTASDEKDRPADRCNNKNRGMRDGTTASEYAIAIDIGTTTVVLKLLDRSTGTQIASSARLNAQITYGADVVSRINAALDDAKTLSALITKQIDGAIRELIAENHIAPKLVRRIAISGNTTMSYILLGLPCRSLGFAPFLPAYGFETSYAYKDIFHSDTLDASCVVSPFISAYVGGDITSGLYALANEDDYILIDMGTNGELVFKRGDRLICTATAAGPAFEGGNIEYGTGSMRGAVSSVQYENGAFRCGTIADAAPTGICGSGILDLMAVLVREHIIDETGAFSETQERNRIVIAENPASASYPQIYFTQKDVRQFQLAKSAIRSGIEILLDEMGENPPSRVFLAGGFGQNLNPESAIITGLLPESFRGRVIPVGNSSLSGAVKTCLNNSAEQTLQEIATLGSEINLATHRLFDDFFMDYMMF
ncbi:MAG: ASKHA domain-containing protein [Clostridiales Family XIII bacterium]|jgi:uncharacterized 2Fe-2S/4Fe-4S cluster protein (DUF4445 family)|nr:ASKHA domain-containing protein [Clostridiales Family XIII bacterium]